MGAAGYAACPVHDRLGEKVSSEQSSINGYGYSQLMKARAVGKCYNCFASDHCIAFCRDPPRCILCSRSGHKARSCPNSAHRRRPTLAPPVWRRRVPEVATAANPPPTPPKKTAVSFAAKSPLPSMDLIPGESWRRPNNVVACAARISAVREAERDLLLHALVAVQRDAHARLTCDGVHHDALQQLRIPPHALQVSRISPSVFLLRFQSSEIRNSAQARQELAAGHSMLHLMPWSRQVGAAGALGRLYYRARVCLEGVPDHAHNIESVLHLLPKQAFVEDIDHEYRTDDEKGCFILWIWCKDPDSIDVGGTLQIEEPMVTHEGMDIYNAESQLPVLRSEEITMLN